MMLQTDWLPEELINQPTTKNKYNCKEESK